jgi:hypothetical protein
MTIGAIPSVRIHFDQSALEAPKPLCSSQTQLNETALVVSNPMSSAALSQISAKLKVLAEKVISFALAVLKFFVAVYLHHVTTTLFILGFVAGVVMPDKMRAACDNITKFWNGLKFNHALWPFPAEWAPQKAILCVLWRINYSVTVPITAFFVGADISSFPGSWIEGRRDA